VLEKAPVYLLIFFKGEKKMQKVTENGINLVYEKIDQELVSKVSKIVPVALLDDIHDLIDTKQRFFLVNVDGIWFHVYARRNQ
jgi:hypothetical protein